MRSWGILVSIAMIGAVLWPLTRDPEREDSFPLSTYPMFARRRHDAQIVLEYVIATGPDGARRHVPPEWVGTHEVLQAMMIVHRAVVRGQAAALCAEVAARLVGDRRFAAMDEVAVVIGDHRAVAFLVHGVRGAERDLARCPLRRGAP